MVGLRRERYDEEDDEEGAGPHPPRPRKERSFGPVQGVSLLGWRRCGEGEKGRSHSWIRHQARSLTALWMGMMEGIVAAREEVALALALAEEEEEEEAAAGRRLSGSCLRSTALKNCCSDG